MPKKAKPIYAKLIVNPTAGKAEETQPDLQLAIQYLQQKGIRVDVAFAKPKEEATPLAKQAVKDGFKLIIAMGGDGTIEAVMRGLVGRKAHLGIIPSGTANNLAKSLEIPEKVEAACDLIVAHPVRKVDAGQVKMKGQKKSYFFEVTSIGLSSALYEQANDLKDGKLSKIKDVALSFLKEEKLSTVYLTLDGESKIKFDTILVVISNTPIFGKNFTAAPSASMEDGLLDISVYPDFSKAELLAYYAKVMNEGYSENDRVQRFRASELEVKASPKLEVMTDGVSVGKGRVRIKLLPGAISVIAPEPSVNLKAKEQAEEIPAPVYPVEEKPIPEEVSS
jgi:YegS/Rv2252/BmrU family lipid kinase